MQNKTSAPQHLQNIQNKYPQKYLKTLSHHINEDSSLFWRKQLQARSATTCYMHHIEWRVWLMYCIYNCTDTTRINLPGLVAILMMSTDMVITKGGCHKRYCNVQILHKAHQFGMWKWHWLYCLRVPWCHNKHHNGCGSGQFMKGDYSHNRGEESMQAKEFTMVRGGMRWHLKERTCHLVFSGRIIFDQDHAWDKLGPMKIILVVKSTQ